MDKKDVLVAIPQYRRWSDADVIEVAKQIGIADFEPSGRGFHPAVDLAMRDMATMSLNRVHYAIMVGDGMLDRARATLFGQFLHDPKVKFDYLMCLDDDLSFPYWSVDRLVSHNLDIVGAAYAYKTSIGSKAGVAVIKGIGETVVPNENHIAEVRWLNGGFMMVSRLLLKDMAACYQELRFERDAEEEADAPAIVDTYAFWMPMIHEVPKGDKEMPILLSEDYAFCQRVLDIGKKIYVDTSIPLTHWDGATPYRLKRKISTEGE